MQGGSTITQQLVRALYIKDPKRNLPRKIREAKLASELEDEHSKTWILNNYLNDIPYGTVGGRTAIGVEAAAVIFFSKHARDLTLASRPLLAGLPQAPSQYNPFRNPSAALARRNEVLERMVKNGYVTQARRTPPRRARSASSTARATARREPYFFDYVQEQLIERYGVGVFRRGGLKIHTTIEPTLQEAARKAIAGQLPYPDDPSSAIVSIDPSNGYIRAMASSGTYKDRTFNLAAQGHRQPGSAFKTMVLTTAIRKGIDPNRTTYTSKPLSLDVGDGSPPWEVKTYDGSYGGTMTLTQATLALRQHRVRAADPRRRAQGGARDGEADGHHHQARRLPGRGPGRPAPAACRRSRWPTPTPRSPSGGMRNEPEGDHARSMFPDGKSDDLGQARARARLLRRRGLRGHEDPRAERAGGHGHRRQIGCPAAGKTGTTDNFNDAWFVGYTPELASSVWVGYPNALVEMSSVHGISGGRRHLPGRDLARLHDGRPRRRLRVLPAAHRAGQFSPFFGKYASTGQDRHHATTATTRTEARRREPATTRRAATTTRATTRASTRRRPRAPRTSRRPTAGPRPTRAAAPTRRTSRSEGPG